MGRVVERKPEWVKFKLPGGETYTHIKSIIKTKKLHTICIEAGCPNIGECFSNGTATFLILGNICTRNCKYCAVKKGIPEKPDINEPAMVSEAVSMLGLKYAVITSVTRDDLHDGGASYFSRTTDLIKQLNSQCRIELLVPDFANNMENSIDEIIKSRPDVINHNIEVVKNYFIQLRPHGDYNLSLKLMERVAASKIPVKSGLMIGFGEDVNDIKNTMIDLCNSGCSIITIGQYLKSTKESFPVKKFYHPDEFEEIKIIAENIGFKKILAGPLVRSSYHADNFLE